VSCLPGSAALAFEDIDLGALDGREHLLRADVWFSEPMLCGGNEKLFRAARDAGTDVSLDLNWHPAWNRADEGTIARRKEAVRSVLPLVDLVHGNVNELCAFADANTLDAALGRIRGWGVPGIVVHMGAEGAGFFQQGRLVREACVPAARVMNATGTGDLLSVCMILLHRRRDVPVEEKLRLANRIVSEYVAGVRSFVPEL
jgi:sugar/nucleoside kinase (ribokinase family)